MTHCKEKCSETKVFKKIGLLFFEPFRSVLFCAREQVKRLRVKYISREQNKNVPNRIEPFKKNGVDICLYRTLCIQERNGKQFFTVNIVTITEFL